MKDRYKAIAVESGNGNWMVFDNKRKVSVLRSVSPNAKYNETVAKNAAYALNICNLPD